LKLIVSAWDRRENALAITCALVRFGVCCYRAVHQAIIVDEATTWNRFASGPWRKLFGRYDANNHILSSVLIKASVTLGHLSPFTLRLPSLIAGLAFTLGVFWLLRRISSVPVRWAAFGLVALHPLLMDFSIVARGYSISLAFFVWGLYYCLEKRYWIAGVLLGLAIAANLSILVPVIALVVLRRSVTLLLLVILVGGAVNYPSLRRAHRDDFYIGYSDLNTAVASFTFTSLHARPDYYGISILGDKERTGWIGVIGLPVFLIAAAALSWRQPFYLQLFTITLFGLILARWLFGINYPADRTCLYFVILGALAWAVAGDCPKNPYARAVWLLPAIFVLIQFSTQLQMHYFQFWRNEADDGIIAQIIEKACEGKPGNSMSISASWIHQPTLEFYRQYRRIHALKPVGRLEPPPLAGFDFYVLSGEDIDRAKQTSLHPLFTNLDIDVILLGP